MSKLILLLQTHGVLIVFATVLFAQIGLPIPAYPVLIVAGAMAVSGQTSWAWCLVAVLAACLLSDYFWFRAGQFYGKRILKLLCKISLSPDSCVSQTEDNFKRFGPKALIVAKFIPGFNTVAPPLAGAMGTGTPRFLLYSVFGALLWGGIGIGIGAYFHTSIDKVLDTLETMGTAAVSALGCLLILFILFKFEERRRFRRGMAVERIGIEELRELISQGHDPAIIDARSTTAQQFESAIPGALMFNAYQPEHLVSMLDKDRHVVVYCSCPNDYTAAKVAKQLVEQGLKRARPLHGGLEAWKGSVGEADTEGGSAIT